MLRMDFTQIVAQRVVRETMVLKKHPGIKMLAASMATRTAKANDCWKESEEISPLCPWCVEKATRVCYGVDTHACRGMLCARCLETFGRCPDCANWVGLPTTFVRNGSYCGGQIVSTPERWHGLQMAALCSAEWLDVWDGCSAVRHFEQ